VGAMQTSVLVSVLVAVLAVAAVAIARFELMCLRDLDSAPDVDLRYLTRSGWMAAILLAMPLGGLAYLYIGRNR
jgi:hypothetical protein